MNKKRLYESIMRSVSIEVKKALNEASSDNDQNIQSNYEKLIKKYDIKGCQGIYQKTGIKYEADDENELIDTINTFLYESHVENAEDLLKWINYEKFANNWYYAICT